MMIAVSNTGVGFLSGSVGGDEDGFSLSRMLNIPLPPALHPLTAFVYPLGGTFRHQFQITPSVSSLSPAMIDSLFQLSQACWLRCTGGWVLINGLMV